MENTHVVIPCTVVWCCL